MILGKDEIVILINKIRNMEYSEEGGLDDIMNTLEDGVSDPDIFNYVFHESPELSADEIADKVLLYKPICL
jgi:hypothetical protein